MPEFQYNMDMDQDIINEKIISNLRETIGEAAANDFLVRFLSDCKERTERINEAYGKSQFSEVELEAHTLGTASATYGAFKLEEICREIEAAQPGKTQAFQDRIDRLNVLSEQSLQALRDYAS